MTLRLHTATIEDIPQLVVLVNSAFRGESSKKGWTTEADLLDGIRTDEDALKEMITAPGAVMLKCMDDELLAGCVYLQKQKTKMYLGMFTVKPDIQSKGIGREMLKASEEYAKEQGCSSITMTVITVRDELIQWYERKGYYKTGERKPFPVDPKFGIPKQLLEFFVMEKDL